MQGPEGKGVYRMANGASPKGGTLSKFANAAPKVRQMAIMLWRFVTEVKIPGRPFILFQDPDAEVIADFILRQMFPG